MTAFSRQEKQGGIATLIWELRSVNHRYLEVSCRLPEGLKELEGAARELCRKKLSRGKVECGLRYQLNGEQQESVFLNKALAQELSEAAGVVASYITHVSPISATDILRWPGVIQTGETDLKTLQANAIELLNSTLEDFIVAREREGAELKTLILQRLASVKKESVKVREMLPKILEWQRKKLKDRLNELVAELDNDRLEQELVYLAQKIDVDEELDRLDTHVDEVFRVLEQGGTVGRRLDFLMQELNREANTLASKSISADSTQSSVELKVLIEQMREQIQNIE